MPDPTPPNPAAQTLEDFLAESATAESDLWRFRWGERDPLDHLEAVLTSQENATSILIDGDYGTGKSSYMRRLERRLESHGHVLTSWLHMPILTSQCTSSAMATVTNAMVARLEEEARRVDDAAQASPPPTAGPLLSDLRRAANDLWTSESPPRGNDHPSTAGEPPRANTLAGSTSQPARSYEAARLEIQIARYLASMGRTLVIFLDDLDRCHNRVAKDIVRLLLRFGATKRVHFVLASDREILEQGVNDWMFDHGLMSDGRPVVTANSALEKYVHYQVRMPSLSDLVQRTGTDLLVDLLTFLPQDQRALAAQACAFLLDPSRETSEVRPFALNGSVLLDAFLVLLLTRSRKRDLTWQSSVATTAGAGSGTGAPATTIPASEVVVPERPRESAPKDEASSDPDLVSEHKQFAVDKQAEEPKKHDRQEAPVVRLISKPSGLANLLRELLVFAPGSGEQPISVLVRRDTIVYKLASFLTLRQLKAFFRRHHAGISETPRQIALEFLDDLFHPIWKLRGDEPELFDMLCRTAAALMRVSVPEGGSSSPQHAPAHVDVTFLDFFGARLVTVLEAATTLTKDDLKKVWPRKTRERRLLVTLLAAARDESRSGTGASLPSYQPLSPPSPGEEGTFGDEMSGLAPPPRPAVPTARLQDLEGQFRDWVQRAVNVPLSSQTLDGMLSEFQDMASDRNLPLTRRHGLVTSYMETFWQQHKRFLSKNAAISLANLGVVIDDARGAEHWADALFTQARRLEPEHERIRLNHAEFLLDVAKDQGRLHTLIQQGENKYANAAAVFTVIESILQFRGGGESNFRRELDLLRLDDLRKGPSDNLTAKNERLFPQASKLVITHAEFLLSAARTRSFSPFFRFSNSLDEIYGGRSVSGIQPASQVLAVAWRFFELALGTRGSWPAAVWIANRYVGQSDTQSEEERIGLGMNRWLLNQPDFVNAEPRQVSLVWSQTGAAISRLGYPNVLRRIALSFAAALEMDPDGLPELAVRVAAAWKFLKKDIRPGLDALRETLVSELDSPARSLLKNGVRAESNLAALTDYVFGTEVLPVGSVAELARRDNWKDEMLTAIETTAVACVEEAGIHRPGMEPS